MKKYLLTLVLPSVLVTSTIYAEGGTLCPLKLSNEEFRVLGKERKLDKGSVKLKYQGHFDTFAMALKRNPNPKLDAGLKENTIVSEKSEQCRYKLGTDTISIPILVEKGEATPLQPASTQAPASKPSVTAPSRPKIAPPPRPRPMRIAPSALAQAAIEDKNTGTFLLQKNPDGSDKIYTLSETETAPDGSTYTVNAEKKILFLKGNDGKTYLAYDPREDNRQIKYDLMKHYNVVFTDDIVGKKVKFDPTEEKIELEGQQYTLAKLKLDEQPEGLSAPSKPLGSVTLKKP